MPGKPAAPRVTASQLFITECRSRPNASVTIMKKWLRKRKQIAPTAKPAAPAASVARGSAAQKLNFASTISTAAVYAPIPANAMWPSDTRPV